MNSDMLFTNKAVSFHIARHLKDKRKRTKWKDGKEDGFGLYDVRVGRRRMKSTARTVN